ncbi:MAG TPA: hypothetical protein VMR34_02410 [Candidatus Saccharimonadales bacterium]|nr:hypothetical protein [Candidatus Saccharimonadales bacterium]
MSGSNSPVTQVAATGTTIASTSLLPFTHGNKTGTYVLIVAISCALIVLLSKLIKHLAAKSL